MKAKCTGNGIKVSRCGEYVVIKVGKGEVRVKYEGAVVEVRYDDDGEAVRIVPREPGKVRYEGRVP